MIKESEKPKTKVVSDNRTNEILPAAVHSASHSNVGDQRPVVTLQIPTHNIPAVDDKSHVSVSAANTPLFSPNNLASNIFMSSMMQGQEQSSTHRLPVPPCEVAAFEGDYASWPTFRDLFTGIFINNSRLSNVERLFHLISKTKGEAKDIVSRAPLTNAGFLLAWNSLSLTYENKRVLVTSQLAALFALQSVKVESPSALKNLQRGITNCLDILTLHEVSVADWDPIIIFLCCQRLPETTIALWEQSIADKKELPKWKVLTSFLTARVLTLESIAGTRQNRIPSPTFSSNSKSHHTQVNVTKKSVASLPSDKSKICPICPKQKHNFRSCAKFRGMTGQERWNVVKRYTLCSNCLSNGHSLSTCPSTFNCATCHQRHHTWLHNFKPQLSSVNLITQNHASNSTFQPSIHAPAFQSSE